MVKRSGGYWQKKDRRDVCATSKGRLPQGVGNKTGVHACGMSGTDYQEGEMQCSVLLLVRDESFQPPTTVPPASIMPL